MNWEDIYKKYPVNEELIWFNNCGVTPPGNHIIESVTNFLNDYGKRGILADTADYEKVRQKIKTILAGLLQCSPSEIALIHNTAEGMNFISHGLHLEKGDEIILLENEYPSNVYPWLHLKEKGIAIKTSPMGNSPEDFFKKILKLVSKKTRLISISAVHWCTGMPLPLSEMGEFCKDNKIDFIVDGAQGVGMIPLNLKELSVSYMVFSAWKWLMGPLGMGVLYVSENKLNELRPCFIGTESVVNDLEYLPYKSKLKPSADRFTISTSNFNDWVYFKAALEFIDKIGFKTVQKRLMDLSFYFTKELKRSGYRVLADDFPDYPSAITVCEKNNVQTDIIMADLKKNNIVAAERLNKIRFSPHIYNSFHQIDKTINLLEKY